MLTAEKLLEIHLASNTQKERELNVLWSSHENRAFQAIATINQQHSGFKAQGRQRNQWIDNNRENMWLHSLVLHLIKNRKLQLPTTLHYE